MEKAREFQKNIYVCFIDYAKAFDCVDHNKLWKILKEMGIPDHLTCLLRHLYADQEATVRTGHGTTDWFQIGKGCPDRLNHSTAWISSAPSTHLSPRGPPDTWGLCLSSVLRYELPKARHHNLSLCIPRIQHLTGLENQNGEIELAEETSGQRRGRTSQVLTREGTKKEGGIGRGLAVKLVRD